MTFKSEKVGIVGHFQEKVGKSRAHLKAWSINTFSIEISMIKIVTLMPPQQN